MGPRNSKGKPRTRNSSTPATETLGKALASGSGFRSRPFGQSDPTAHQGMLRPARKKSVGLASSRKHGTDFGPDSSFRTGNSCAPGVRARAAQKTGSQQRTRSGALFQQRFCSRPTPTTSATLLAKIPPFHCRPETSALGLLWSGIIEDWNRMGAGGHAVEILRAKDHIGNI